MSLQSRKARFLPAYRSDDCGRALAARGWRSDWRASSRLRDHLFVAEYSWSELRLRPSPFDYASNFVRCCAQGDTVIADAALRVTQLLRMLRSG